MHVTTTEDGGVGDESEDTTVTVVDGAVFEPERRLSQRTAERTGDDRVPVLQPAVWNLPGIHTADSDDRIIDGDATADGFDIATAVTWQVLGQGDVWLDRTKVPVQQPRNI